MKMTRVRVQGFTISLDGYGAGPNQDIRNPLGVGGTDLHQWLVPTRPFQRTLFGVEGGTTGIGADLAAGGGQPPLSRSNFHLDSSRAPAHPDGRRNDILLRHGRYSRGA